MKQPSISARGFKRRRGGWERPGFYAAPGAVYLMKCRITGEYKFGGSNNPYPRLLVLQSSCRWQAQPRELVLVWSIATNCVGYLEQSWRAQWREFRIDRRYDWVNLPKAEVDKFRTYTQFLWDNHPPIKPAFLKLLLGLPQDRTLTAGRRMGRKMRASQPAVAIDLGAGI